MLAVNCASAQEAGAAVDNVVRCSFEKCLKPFEQDFERAEKSFVKADEIAAIADLINPSELPKTNWTPTEFKDERRSIANDSADSNAEQFTDQKSFVRAADAERFHWKPALIQSGIMLGVQHGFRMSQKRTRRELGGEFLGDWAHSVKNLRGWADGDQIFINYVAHPLQGGTTGRIFVNNSDRAKKQEFGNTKKYWESRFKALVWSAAWSTQFELGPISEASLGNVGLRQSDRHKMAWVDLIVTPIAGTGVVVGEDAIDKYVLKNWLERQAAGKATAKIKLLRSLLTPTMSVANLLRLKVPWKRDNRFN